MKVEEILKPAIIADEEETVSRTVSKMARERVRDMFLVKEGVLQGMVTHHSLLDAMSNSETTKIRSLMFRPPTLQPSDDIEKAITYMLDVGIESVPVIKDRKLKGRVVIEDILRQFNSKNLTASSIMSISPKLIYEDDTIAHARAAMKNHGISRLLVVNRQGKLTGIVTASDILRKNAQKEKMRKGIMSYKTSVLNSPVSNIMTSNVETVKPTADLNKVVSMMIRHNIRLMPVVDSNKPVGLISRKQVIALMLDRPQEGIIVNFSGIKGFEPFEIETMRHLTAGYMEKLGRMVGSTKVSIKLKRIGHSKHQVKIVAGEGKDTLMVESTAFDIISALSEALRTLERKVKHD